MTYLESTCSQLHPLQHCQVTRGVMVVVVVIGCKESVEQGWGRIEIAQRTQGSKFHVYILFSQWEG